MSVAADNPIRKPEEDVLGRAKVVLSFTEQVLQLDMTEGVVVGALGPWGSGKTSFINLARAHLEDTGITVLDFNPWMFSGAEQLIERFFVELSAQMEPHSELAKVGKALDAYGEVVSGLGWLPMVGPWVERGGAAVQTLSKILLPRKEGVDGLRTMSSRHLMTSTNRL